MAFTLAALKADLDSVVNEATNLADLADKYCALAAEFSGAVPGASAEIKNAAAAVDDLDKALHAVKAAVDAL